jgi:hypothetical protein
MRQIAVLILLTTLVGMCDLYFCTVLALVCVSAFTLERRRVHCYFGLDIPVIRQRHTMCLSLTFVFCLRSFVHTDAFDLIGYLERWASPTWTIPPGHFSPDQLPADFAYTELGHDLPPPRMFVDYVTTAAPTSKTTLPPMTCTT